jgi:hypothetical protein
MEPVLKHTDDKPHYTVAELTEIRRDILRYARWNPPGPERNEHRQIAQSLRRLFKDKAWLNAHTIDFSPAPAPFSCRLKPLSGERFPDEGICAFEFPWCEGCPRSSVGTASLVERDPMKSAIWRGWINGITGIKK